MKSRILLHTCAALLLAQGVPAHAADAAPAHLPGELSADEILNGAYPFPPSPPMEAHDDSAGLDRVRLGKTPPPGVHPRILISPEELPDLRRRLRETEMGRTAMATLESRINDILGKPGWGKDLYELLAVGDVAAVDAALDKQKGMPSCGHYQPYLMAMTMEALRALIAEDQVAGKRAAAALTCYSKLVTKALARLDDVPLNDDVWRARPDSSKPGTWSETNSPRDLVGYHLLGYAYDFTSPFMAEDQRAVVRAAISKATKGKLWMGARLPHHFRDWNWVAIGTESPLMALAIEGEDGYDARVYKLGVEIANDYLTYGISPSGCSTEAVGYTQFGLNWFNPFVVAATRRGEKLLTHSHFRGMLTWYCHALDPQGAKWTSHGDGGDAGPSLSTLSMWRYFFPEDPRADFLWQNLAQASKGKPFDGKPHMIEALLFATDGPNAHAAKPLDYAAGAKLELPLTWFDPVRSSLFTRSAWSGTAAKLEFECRTDSFSASHEHADRGSFTFNALGRDWSKDNFRSVETRHHNAVLIDGLGQGFWPGPGKWLGLKENANALIAACDAKDAYCWMWPKQAGTEKPGFLRYTFPRWKDYADAAEKNAQLFQGLTPERETRPSVVAAWEPYFDKGGGPHLWDEDTWPVRYPHNPVQRAFRTVAFVRGASPYLIVIDDLQKDDRERLYEWLMQTGPNTEAVSISTGDTILCDATAKHDENGAVKPAKGDRQLLVRVLEMNEPKLARDYQSRPSIRLEAFERKDTFSPDGRTFGLDKRLVIPSRSVAPNFKILLFPHRHGELLPLTTWNDDKTRLTVQTKAAKDEFTFIPGPDGRTRVEVTRGEERLKLE